MRYLLLAFGLAACTAPGVNAGQMQTPMEHCKGGEFWNGEGCHPAKKVEKSLAEAEELLADIEIEAAISVLRKSLAQGPLAREDLIAVHEKLGISHAYLGQEQQALDAFGFLLALAPGHLLSYTLSPRALFVFEKARTMVAARPGVDVELRWRRERDVQKPLRVELDVVSDPLKLLRSGVLHLRRSGEDTFRGVSVDLKAGDSDRELVLPPIGTKRKIDLEYYVSGYDEKGNQVYRSSNPLQPRSLLVGYREPTKWYKKWWVITLGVGAAALGTGATVFLLTREPPGSVPASGGVVP